MCRSVVVLHAFREFHFYVALFSLQYTLIRISIRIFRRFLSSVLPHHDDGGEESGASAHHDETVNEPGGPDDTIANTHGFHGLFQAEFLLEDNTLYYH